MEIQQGSTSEEGVLSINGLTGDVILAAGANITLTPAGNTITIASTGGSSPVYPDTEIVFGDGSTAGGVTTASLTYNQNGTDGIFTLTGNTDGLIHGLIDVDNSIYSFGSDQPTGNIISKLVTVAGLGAYIYADNINIVDSFIAHTTRGNGIVSGGSDRITIIGNLAAFGSIGSGTTISVDDNAQTYTFSKLATVGVSEMVIVDLDGVLSSTTIPTGTVTSVATGVGLTGGTITTTGTIELNTKLAPMDTLTGNSLKVLRVNVGETAVEYFTPSFIPSLTATQVGFGDATNLLSGSSNFIYDTTNGIFDVKFNSPAGIRFTVNASTGSFTMSNNGATTFFVADTSSVRMGDVTAGGNSSKLTVDDFNQLLTWNKRKFTIGTAAYTFPVAIAAVSGQVLTDVAANGTLTWETPSGGSLTVGTTTIASGTDTRILYDNSGVLGEYTITGTGTVVAMATAPVFVTSITTPSVFATSNDSGPLGAAGTAFSDLFLAEGGVINWDSGDVIITQTGNDLAFAGASTYRFDGIISTTTAITLEETGAGTDVIAIQAPVSIAAGYTLTLPVDDGTPNQVMTTDGSGVLSWTTPTTGTVTSVSGTSNRITSTGGATPVIDIAATYVGQASITTVGTLTSGATGAGFTIALGTSTITGVLPIANGGTNANSQVNNGVNYFDGTSIKSLATFLFDGTNLGIGTTPDSLLTVSKQTTIFAAPSGTTAHFVGLDANSLVMVLDTHNNAGAGGTAFRGRRSRGTAGTPTATLSGDTIISFNGMGYGATAYAAASTGLITLKANQNFTDSAMGTYATVFTTPDGSVTAAEALRITGAGNLNIFQAAGAVQINGTSVLNATTLGPGVVTSSLTAVGTIVTGVWNGTTIAVANGGTAGTTPLAARTNLGTNTYIDSMQLLGSAAVSQTFGATPPRSSATTNLTDGAAVYIAMDAMPAGLTITGIKWIQVTQGNYTADNNNKVGLYSYSGGTLTQVAACANDGNLWKAAPGIVLKAFSSTYITVANTQYFIGYIYNNSAQVTAPAILNVTNSSATAFILDFTNSGKLGGFLTAQTDIAGSQAMSGLTALSGTAYMLLY